MERKKVLIEEPFYSRTNRIFIENETHTLGVPLCEAINKNPKCEVATYNQKNITTHQGILFSLRSSENEKATTIFREGLEDLYSTVDKLLKLSRDKLN